MGLAVAENATGLVELLLLAGDVAGRGGFGALFLVVGGDLTRNLNNVAFDTVLAEIVLGGLEAVGPLAGGSVLATEEKSEGHCTNDDTRNDKGNAPRRVLGDALGDK